MNHIVINQLAGDAYAMAVKFGAVLIKAETRCNSGLPDSAKALTILTGQINLINGMLNSLYYTAKSTLTAEEFEDFCKLSKIERNLIENGLRAAAEEFKNSHYELSEN